MNDDCDLVEQEVVEEAKTTLAVQRAVYVGRVACDFLGRMVFE